MAFYSSKKSSDMKKMSAMTLKERDEAVAKLERERMKINAEIEGILRAYAKESGNNALKNRKHRIGASPNDYGFVGRSEIDEN